MDGIYRTNGRRVVETRRRHTHTIDLLNIVGVRRRLVKI
jgi:hypothetical protein